MPIICNNCGQNLPDDSVFCPKCGTKVPIIRCTGCGTVLTADARFCPSCGTPAGNSEVPAKPDTRMEQTPQAVEIQKAPAVLQTAPDNVEQRLSGQTTLADAPKQAPHHFDWKYWGVSILRGYGTTRNSVEVTDENVVLTSKLNKRAIYDATAVPLKDIASVEVWEKVSVISALMVAILVGGFIGLVALIPFGVTAIDPGSAEGIGSMLGLIILLAIVIFAALFGIHHWRITIKTRKEPQYRIYELSAKTQDHEMLFQLQDAILTRAGIKGEPMHKKSNKLVPTYIASILVAFAIVAAMLLSHPEIFETKQTDDSVDKESVQSVENEPAIQPQDETIQRSPGYGQWAYDSEDAIESHKEYPDTTISEDLVGCWEFECATFNTGETISREDGVIAYFRVYPDNMYSYVEMSPSESASSGVWQVIDEQVILSSYDDNDERVVTLDGNIMYLEKSDKVVCYMKVSEQPDYEDGANAAGEDTSDDITDDSAFNFQNITGSWQDETGENYLFIGYSDESRRDARAYFTMAQGFETVLSTLDKDGAEGVVMDYAGEIAFQIDISGYKYWLEVTLQDADTGETHYLKYYPADMESCPYYNPYYLDT